jgi:hypothetical protein
MQGGTIFGDLICASESYGGAFADAEVRGALNEVACHELQQLIYLIAGDDTDRTLIGPPHLVKETMEKLKKMRSVKVTGSHVDKE